MISGNIILLQSLILRQERLNIPHLQAGPASYADNLM